MGYVLAGAAVVGTLAALATVIFSGLSIGKLNDTLKKMDEQLEAAREGREADERVARIAALEGASECLSRIIEATEDPLQRDLPFNETSAPRLAIERARLAAAVRAVYALHGKHLADCLSVATTTELRTWHGVVGAANKAMLEIGSALEDEVKAARNAGTATA
jgi:hypothetical protein